MNAPIDEDELAAYETELFASLRRDEPSASARRAVASGLGIGAIAATGATIAPHGAAIPATSAKIGPLLVVKWMGVGVTAGAVSLGALHYAAPTLIAGSGSHSASTAAPTSGNKRSAISAQVAPPAANVAQTRSESAPTQAAPGVDSRESPLSPAAGRGPRAPLAAGLPPAGEVASRAVLPAENVAPPAEPSTNPVLPSTLAAEVAILDSAQNAVTAREPARALGLLDQYARDFPDGTLRPEAEVLRIEALFSQGSISEAVTAGRNFLQAHPTSTHANRVRRHLADYQER